ncbi:fluoride efflux transporter CrcB [Caulobacter flavus]|uniref:Fluoride-specific ion channel FluC n=1 Tax=Caulobacter flavus TaxID=1679497 RepID=A0A2N5CKW1_9CAUL|nr:fluoride efflux transporter CrcB [Caulobacter flavus]AYV47249.1 fluoride efflux transporter CrcB [Caulobacter flavus]PLR06214.1 fluoride efflux transporter CrcB [Caulobacter flavus]
MTKVLLVAVGGAAGSVARYLVGAAALRWIGPGWPWGTMTVNIVGGFLMGLLTGWLALKAAGQQETLRVLLGVGILGGFTTFSAFSLDAALMIERRAYGQAFSYTAASVLIALAALFAGLYLARRMFAA